MSIEVIKAIAKLSPLERTVFTSIPPEHQDTLLNDLDTFKHLVARQHEFYISLGFEPSEAEDALVRSIVQSYDVAR